MNLGMRLYRRDNGVWYIAKTRNIRVSLETRDEKTARRIFNNQKRIFLANKLVALQQGLESRTLAGFAREYLDYAAKVKRPATVRADSLALRRLMVALGPEIPLGKISRRQLDLFLTSLTVKPVSANTYLRHLKAAFSRAVAWDYLKTNPCQGIKERPVDQNLPRYLTPQEVDRLLAAEADRHFRILWLFYLRSGCRRAEALQIQAQDIDWEHRRLIIPRTKNRRPKVVVLTPDLIEILRAIPVTVGRLFPWKADWVSHKFQRTARRAGLQARLHDLRHTYGTNLAMAGVDSRVIQEVMGHLDSKATAVYIHLQPEYLEKELAKVKRGSEG
jgi:integrase